MRLDHVVIANFRSIKHASISLTPACRAIVGINEAGKSNVLRALALLDPSTQIERDDVRESLPTEDPVTEATIDFVFLPSKAELEHILTVASVVILVPKAFNAFVTSEGKQVPLLSFIQSQCIAIYSIDLISKTRSKTIYAFPEDTSLVDNWSKPKDTCPTDLSIMVDGASREARGCELVLSSLIPRDVAGHFEQASIDDVFSYIQTELEKQMDAQFPACVYWKYSDNQLLPGRLDIAAFESDPTICMPLKNMFALAGYANASEAITSERPRTNGLRNLFRRVADKSTKHFQDVWREYPAIRFDLRENGTQIEAGIQDEHNYFDVARRSDGFKRFVAFLLNISARVHSASLKNMLLLCDEPDTSLHPSGTRCLREELVSISKTNYVVFSSHSIFMVDTNCIGRHAIVKKTNEITSIYDANESNVIDEEVIYNAMGFTFKDILPANNVVFEGWRDKYLYRTFVGHDNPIHNRIGTCHARGVKDIEHVTALLDLSRCALLVISDGDDIAIQYQRGFRGPGDWLRYDEILKDKSVVTAEDFLKLQRLISVGNDWAKDLAGFSPLTEAQFLPGQSRIQALKTWVKNSGLTADPLKRALDSLKDRLFQDLAVTDIENNYKLVVDFIHLRFK